MRHFDASFEQQKTVGIGAAIDGLSMCAAGDGIGYPSYQHQN
jgi:hypothetical protein